MKPKSSSAISEIPHILWSPNVHYRVHNRPPLVLKLSHMNPAYALSLCSRLILILSYHLRLGLPIDLYLSVFSPPAPQSENVSYNSVYISFFHQAKQTISVLFSVTLPLLKQFIKQLCINRVIAVLCLSVCSSSWNVAIKSEISMLLLINFPLCVRQLAGQVNRWTLPGASRAWEVLKP